MEGALVLLVLVCFAITGAHIYRYLRSTFALLELVQRDEALWSSLGRPRKTHVREPTPGGFHTIQPIGPWLAWVWKAEANGYLRPEIAELLQATSRLLKRGLILFAVTLAAMVMLALSGK